MHLNNAELEYELNMRGMFNVNGTQRNRAKRVRDVIDRENANTVNPSPWGLDRDLTACETSIYEIEAYIQHGGSDDFAPREIYSRLLYLEARTNRMVGQGHDLIRIETATARVEKHHIYDGGGRHNSTNAKRPT